MFRHKRNLLSMLLILTFVPSGCVAESTLSPVTVETNSQSFPTPSVVTENLPDKKELTEKYYDYFQKENQILGVTNGLGYYEDEPRDYYDNLMTLYTYFSIRNSDSPDYSQEEYQRISMKHFGKRIENFVSGMFYIEEETGNVLPTGWGYNHGYFVLKNYEQDENKDIKAEFYVLERFVGDDDWPESEQIKADLLSGRFEGYGSVCITVMEFREDSDDDGMYLRYHSIQTKTETQEEIKVYGCSE